jgi:hypothetical protein
MRKRNTQRNVSLQKKYFASYVSHSPSSTLALITSLISYSSRIWKHCAFILFNMETTHEYFQQRGQLALISWGGSSRIPLDDLRLDTRLLIASLDMHTTGSAMGNANCYTIHDSAESCKLLKEQ